MGIENTDFTTGQGAMWELINRFKKNGVPGVSFGGNTATVESALPEIAGSGGAVLAGLAIAAAVKLSFGKLSSLMHGIWVVGGAISSAVDAVGNWVLGMFSWLDSGWNYASGNIGSQVAGIIPHLFDINTAIIQQRLNSDELMLQNLNTAGGITSGDLYNQLTQLKAREFNDVNALHNQLSTDIRNLNDNIQNAIKGVLNQLPTSAALLAEVQAALEPILGQMQTQLTAMQTTIDSVVTKEQQDIATLTDRVASIEATITADTNGLAQTINKLSSITVNLQGEIVQEEGVITAQQQEIATLQSQVYVPSNALSILAGLSIAAVATLTQLAEDPCMCLAPIGGIATLEAMITGLEVGIL